MRPGIFWGNLGCPGVSCVFPYLNNEITLQRGNEWDPNCTLSD